MRKDVNGDKKQEILEKTFRYVVEKGLENANMRELFIYVGSPAGSVYYWFENKVQLICSSMEYGLRSVMDKMFETAFLSFDGGESFFADCFDKLHEFKAELRAIYQVAASPVYGNLLKKKRYNFYNSYAGYARKIACRIGCDEDDVKPVVYMFASSILSYIVWDDEERSRMKISYINDRYRELCTSGSARSF